MANKFPTYIKQHRGNILHRWVDENGVHRSRVEEDLTPTLFFISKEDVGYKSLVGNKFLKPVTYDSVQDARDAIKRFEGVTGMEIHGTRNWEIQWTGKHYPDEIVYNPDHIIKFLVDIEVRSNEGFPDPMFANQEVTAITIHSSIDNIYHVWSTAKYSPKNSAVKKIQDMSGVIDYVRCQNEDDLLMRFMSFWRTDYPNIISGWNSKGFDIPYLINRIGKLYGKKTANILSPFGVIIEHESGDFMSKTMEYEIVGVEHLDYLELYKKYTPGGKESYKLAFIAEEVLGEGDTKIKFEGTLDELWLQNPQLYIDYNITDVELLVRMDKKLKMIQLQVELAYQAKTNYENVFSPVKLWTCLVYNALIKENIILPVDKKGHKEFAYEGAYVKEPPAGLFDNVVTVDAASLYPSMIITCNISPETMVLPSEVPEELLDYYRHNLVKKLSNWDDVSEMTAALIKYDMTIAANGQLYYKSKKGIAPTLIKEVLDNRKKAKNEMLRLKKILETTTDEEEKLRLSTAIGGLSVREQGLKVVANAFYGAMGSEYFILFNIYNAEAITLSGQVSNLALQSKVNGYIRKLGFADRDYILAGDTDSIFLDLNCFVEKFKPEDPIDFLSKFSDGKLADVLAGFCNEIWARCNPPENRLSFKREKIISTICFTGAKKRYFCLVHDNEGVRYAKPKLSITGLETNRSSTPRFCRDKLTDAFMLILERKQDELIDMVNEVEESFNTLPVEDISFPRSVNDLAKYASGDDTIFKKGAPQNVKAALVYNFFIEKMDLKQYAPIKSGTKIKFCYMKPSPYRSDIFGWADGGYPKELNIEKYVDRNKMFEKAFLDPLKAVTSSIGYNVRKVHTVDSWFS